MEPTNQWLEITATVNADLADTVAAFLIEQGSTGVVEEEKKGTPGIIALKAYYDKGTQPETLIKTIETYLRSLYAGASSNTAPPQILINHIPDEDWNKKWKSFFEPIRVTRRIVIKPSWRSYWPTDDDIIIELDPGMAFGTGTHPSTRMCLQAIEELSTELPDPKRLNMLDVGTGSGILALAGVLLGLDRAVGIDNDFQAIAAAKKNAAVNGAADRLELSTTPLKKIEGTYPLVVANILPHVLIAMRDDLTARMTAGGFLVLSGIINEKAAEVRDSFSEAVTFHRELHEEEWACLVFKKTS
ncbi:MAG: 50S ribosomal protein L11 methyltransferase [Deltaproteobacteria bacterium]|nr:50S ribosomal protein L11 methyltransferase [Deltaproteobacteria bacterium]